MQAYFVKGVSAESLGRLLKWGSENQRWSWLYGEQILGFTLVYLAEEAVTGWERWSHGRVFSRSSELAWWQTDEDNYRLRLLTETDELPPNIIWGDGESWQFWGEGTTKTLLHGTLDTNRSAETGHPSWSEGRIPQYLFYPVEIELENVQEADNIRTVLETQPYARSGVVGLTRLVQVQLER